MSTKIPANPNPFTDPNAAFRMFNQYFGDLRKQYGEDVIRQVGFTPKEFQDLQASLRKLQLDPRATPEQHREAYMQARDTLARRLTTPLEATRAFGEVPQPKPAPSPAPAVGNDGTMPPVVPMPVMSPDRKSPTQEQIYSYARAVGQGETGLWDPTRGVFVMTAQPPQPQGGPTQAAPFDVAAAAQAQGGMPMPVARPADPGFDINIATNTFYKALGDRVKSGQMTLDQARAAQAEMRALQLNPAAANRQAATEIAQRHLQVGPYSPANVAAQKAAQQPQGGLTQAAPYDAAAAYRQNAQKLAEAVKAGQITVERARQLQAPLFAATKLGSTPEGQAAMNAAAAQAQGGMPMSGYDAAAQYRNFGQELMGMIKSGALTVEQANALKAPVFNAVKLGNSNAGYQQMQAALAAARQQMGGQDMGVTVRPVMPQPMPQPQEIVVTGQRMPEPQPPMPVMPPPPVVYDTFRPETPPPMALPGGTGYDEQGNMIRFNPNNLAEIGGMLSNFGKGIGNAPTQPKFIGQHFTGDAPPPGMKYIETPEGLVPVPINDVPVKPAMGPGLGMSLGMPMQGVGMAPQMPQGMTLSNVPRQLTLSNVPMQGAAPQPVSAPQGMAMGGLLRKYYGGGMC